MAGGISLLGEKVKQETVISGEEEDAPLFKNIVDIGIVRDSLFLVDHFGNQILHYSLSPNIHFKKSIGRKGQGPGDLYLPYQIFCCPNKIVVKDNSSFSFFDLNGNYIEKFPCPRHINSFCHIAGKTYCLEVKSNAPHLIKVYNTKGQSINSFAPKFLDHPIKKKLKYISQDFVESCIFNGKLLCDQKHIYYIGQRYGNLLKFTLSGKKVLTATIIDHFKKTGQNIVAANNKTFAQCTFDVPSGPKRGVPNHYLFEAAALHDNHIYLASTTSPQKSIPPTLTIRTFQTNSLQLISTKTFPLKPDSRLESIAVRHHKSKKELFLNLRTPQGSQIEKISISKQKMSRKIPSHI
jgi:hypothetical protein